MYPTIIEDVSGNQIIITYDTGASLPDVLLYPYNTGQWANSTPNTSSRIFTIDDVRGTCSGFRSVCNSNPGSKPITYQFTYDRTTYSIPHLTSVANTIGTSENYSFTYATTPLQPPFGTDASYSGATTQHLASMATAWLTPLSVLV